MLVSTRLLAGIATAISLFASQALCTDQVGKSMDGVAIDFDGSAVLKTGFSELRKSEFLDYLESKESMLIAFYDDDDEKSENVLTELETFADEAATRYPNLVLRKVSFTKSPYLAARMLLSEIPELRLLIKDQNSEWAAYDVLFDDGVDGVIEYMDKQMWYKSFPIGSRSVVPCSPFNACGKTLAFIAEQGNVIDEAIPLPRWLTVILVPAVIAFVGRFIIEGMYAAEESVRSLFRRDRNRDQTSTSAKTSKGGASSLNSDNKKKQ